MWIQEDFSMWLPLVGRYQGGAQSEAYLGGHWAMAPPLAKKFVFHIKKRLENLVGPLLSMSTSGQAKIWPPLSKS